MYVLYVSRTRQMKSSLSRDESEVLREDDQFGWRAVVRLASSSEVEALKGRRLCEMETRH
jgi:hypothetical protein